MRMGWCFAAVLVGGLSSLSFSANYGGGLGTAEDPYQIWTPEQMNMIGANSSDWNKCFKLMADIDMSVYTGTQYNIIGATYNTPFTGSFDGNGHLIHNLTYVTIASTNYIGLFGRTKNATIQNLGITNVFISSNGQYIGGLIGWNSGLLIGSYVTGSVIGNSCVGGLAGNSDGSISKCCSTSTVIGSACVGGLVGSNPGDVSLSFSTGIINILLNGNGIGGLAGVNYGSIYSSYSTCAVSGSSAVGGLVGYNNGGNISQCYSTGLVSGNQLIGGLVGDGFANYVINSFWDTQTSSQMTSAGGTGKTTPEMQDPNTFLVAGWDLLNETNNGTGNYWFITVDTYPAFIFLLNIIPKELPGNGTLENPYIISDANDLGTIWYHPSAHYKLVNNINLTGINWSTAIIPVFYGVLNGDGYSIQNINIHGGSFLGLLGSVWSGGLIENLGLENCTISGFFKYIGGLAGFNHENCSISGCYSKGTISGSSYIGGLTGQNFGMINNCYSTVSVYGFEGPAGGLIGMSQYNIISNCHSTGTVNGHNVIGGLVGQCVSTIQSCYSTSSVVGNESVGGLVGYCSHTIHDSYSCGIVEGYDNVGGLVGHSDNGRLINCYSVSSVWGNENLGGLVGYQFTGGIENCYSQGNVTGNSHVGGLVGESYGAEFWMDPEEPPLIIPSYINNSYSTGLVTGTSRVGGLVASGNGYFTEIDSSFWDTETSGRTTSDGGNGKTTIEMQNLNTFLAVGWDFTNEPANGTSDIWRMCADGVDYPWLNWESMDGDFQCPDGVSVEDLDYFVGRWLMDNCTADNNYCGGADMDISGNIDLNDWAIFADHWLE